MGKYFGTDGIRGMANQHPITTDIALRLGMAIGSFFKSNSKVKTPKVLIGKDTRISCYMLEQALGAGISSMGVQAFFLGPIPTPGIAYLTNGMRASAGVVISASHNPYYDNGIKIFAHNGFKLPDEVENKLEKLMDNTNLSKKLVSHQNIGRARRIDDAIGQYAVFLKESFPKDLALDGIRIVLDCAHGASYKVAPKVFEELGAEVFIIGNNPNGVNINENCGALHPKAIQEKVLLYKADLGIALDGDADRLIVVDEKGTIIDGDHLMAICAKYMKERKTLAKNTVVTTVMSNIGLDICLKSNNIKVTRVKVGDRYVVEHMLKRGYNLGGENSGHLIFLDSNTTGDGILASLKILEIMLRKKQPLSELSSIMQSVPQILLNVVVKSRKDFMKVPEISKSIKSLEKKLGTNGRVFLRYSGTEKLLRILVEGKDEEYITDQANYLSELAKKHL